MDKKNLDALYAASSELYKVLEETQNKIKLIESDLNEKKMFFFFSILVESSKFFHKGEELKKRSFLCWSQDIQTKYKTKYRLSLVQDICPVSNYNKEITADVTYGKALLDSNLETRMHFVKYTDLFMDEFTQYLIDLNQKFTKDKP